MKPLVLAVLVSLLAFGCSQPTGDGTATSGRPLSPAEQARSPLEVVNLRMQAYNDHDLDTFLRTYSDDVEIFTYPSRSLGKGKSRLQEIFESLFREGLVQVEIHHQIAKDSYVINHETVVAGDDRTEYVSIYKVEKGLIRSVRFVRD